MRHVAIISEEDLQVPALSHEEKKWIVRLQKVLASCPSRLELVIIGDPSVNIVSNEKYSEHYDGRSFIDGVLLACIDGKPKIHGVSG